MCTRMTLFSNFTFTRKDSAKDQIKIEEREREINLQLQSKDIDKYQHSDGSFDDKKLLTIDQCNENEDEEDSFVSYLYWNNLGYWMTDTSHTRHFISLLARNKENGNWFCIYTTHSLKQSGWRRRRIIKRKSNVFHFIPRRREREKTGSKSIDWIHQS